MAGGKNAGTIRFPITARLAHIANTIAKTTPIIAYHRQNHAYHGQITAFSWYFNVGDPKEA